MQQLVINPKNDKNRARALFTLHPRSIELSKLAQQHFLYGVPMHWMNDWGTPVPLFVEAANGAHFTCADEIDYTDFCLGDTGAMFGHQPASGCKRD